MKRLLRIFIAILCLFAALACYAFGVPAGGAAFVVLGIVLEGAFWFGLFKGRSKIISRHD